MGNKFVSEYATITKPLCATCVHRSDIAPRFCIAFPGGGGIPVDILTNKAKHDKPYRGDHGVQYLAKS